MRGSIYSKIIVKKINLLNYILIGFLIILYWLAPRQYDFYYIVVCFVITLFSFFAYIRKRNKEDPNFLDFEPVFLIISILLIYIFPLFVYRGDDSLVYVFSFYEEYSLDFFNKGVSYASIGIVAFIAGSSAIMSPGQVQTKKKKMGLIRSTPIFVMTIPLIILFIYLGGLDYYRALYQDGSSEKGVTTYLEYFIIADLQVITCSELWNKSVKKTYKLNLWYIGTVIIVAIVFLLVGARTQALYLLLPCIIFYARLKWTVSLKHFILFILLAILSMSFFQFYRAGYQFSFNLDWYYYISDLLIPNTNTYLAAELVNERGLTYGLSMLSGLLLLIPFGQNMFISLTGIGLSRINSSSLFTNYLGITIGMGTNFYADIYLAFGLIGIVLIPYYFGKLLKITKAKLFKSYYSTIVYFVVCGFSVYLVRSAVLFMFRFIVYAIVIAYLNFFLGCFFRNTGKNDDTAKESFH